MIGQKPGRAGPAIISWGGVWAVAIPACVPGRSAAKGSARGVGSSALARSEGVRAGGRGWTAPRRPGARRGALQGERRAEVRGEPRKPDRAARRVGAARRRARGGGGRDEGREVGGEEGGWLRVGGRFRGGDDE